MPAPGVDIDQTDAAKRAMATSMETADPRVLNRIGAFATLLDARFPGYAHPVLVHKSEEPGSKQKLAFAHGRHRGVCYDMVNPPHRRHHRYGCRADFDPRRHRLRAAMDGAIVNDLVNALADACRQQGCTLDRRRDFSAARRGPRRPLRADRQRHWRRR